ncbi:glycosyltransferase family 4 protein [Nocardioides litoris]|uniref:glycosyltransferase family 4 protein n=1 Tax=Nocardioides litoris TaxID=1926648 RepID=UPI00111F5252|nr:glycosyltransferase family 4 protein [Nocardioides litoris]
MRSYVEELVVAWRQAFPDDELLLLGYDYLRELEGPGVEARVGPEGAWARAWGQWVGAGRAARRWGADALVSSSSVVSPLFPRARRVAVVHDWRHRVSPGEFGRGQRLYRRTWRWSLQHAGTVVAISDKTLRETRAFAPRARAVLVRSGRDQARRWPHAERPGTADGKPVVVTFGHFPNKRPELVVDAVARLGTPVRLVVLGARGAYADELAARARAAGLDGVELPGFVDAATYQALVATSDVVVLASSDEGFGLPVAEAGWFGVPCVVTDDGGLPEIHGDRVLVAAPDATALAERVAEALRTGRRPGPSTEVETWSATVQGIRAALAGDRAGLAEAAGGPR